MIKRLILLCVVCLPALLLLSCSDGGSESGVEQSSTSGDQTSQGSEGYDNQPTDSQEFLGALLKSAGAVTSWPCIYSYDNGRRVYYKYAHHKSIAKGTGGAYRVSGRSTEKKAKTDAVNGCNRYYSNCSTYDVNGDVCGTTIFDLTSPNGGQKWNKGKKYTIKWTKGKAGGTVKIQLLKSGKHYRWVAKNTKNDGKHAWKIPTKTATGSTYKIKITSTKNKKITDQSSKNFTIRKASSGNYSYLCARNKCSSFSNRTRRYPSKVISVSGAKKTIWRTAAKRWPTVSFRFVSSAPSQGIRILGYKNLASNICGQAQWWYYSSGKLGKCNIKINSNISNMNCVEAWTMTHEVGHCIGVFTHTTDGGIMDSGSAGSNGQISSPIKRMIKLLYSLSPGTNISSRLSSASLTQQPANSQYEPNGTRLIYGGTLVTLEHQ